MLLRCFLQAVMSAVSSSSEDCANRHNNAVELLYMIVNILIMRLNVQKTELL